MLPSLALVLLMGLLFGWLFQRIGLPSLVGMLLAGIVLGPYVFDWLSESLLIVSADFREIALVIILFRAGLSLKLSDFKAIGWSAILMTFIPATLEMIGVTLLGTWLFQLPISHALTLGAVLAAVSPAVVVPSMIQVIEKGYGQKHRVPQLVLAGASADDIYVIVLFSSFLAMAQGGHFSVSSLLTIPLKIMLGIVLGGGLGWLAQKFYKRYSISLTMIVIQLLALAFLLLGIEEWMNGILPISGLLAIMTLGLAINHFYPKLATKLTAPYNKLWSGAQILLFVLVGATVDIHYAASAGMLALVVILGALVFRIVGVFLSLLPSHLTMNEKIFTAISYTPKATVQAAIGGVPLAVGLSSGQLILTMAVLAILITAPIGSFLIEKTFPKLLEKDE